MSGEKLVFQYTQESSQRLDHFLVSHLSNHSRSYLQSLIKGGNVTIDGHPITKTGYKLEKEQSIEIFLPPPAPSQLQPEEIPLDIIYEDQNLVIVNKPAGMVVHPSAGHHSGTLMHAILAYMPDIQGVGGVQRPGLVHRLDKDTSGLILLAKNDDTHHYLQSLFKNRVIDKTYLALVDTAPPTPIGRIEAAIARDPKNRQRMAIMPEGKGRNAISEYKIQQSFTNHTLLEVKIFTGRTHQIRLHLAFINCPVVGDKVYGRSRPTLPVKRQMLHAHQISFILPNETNPSTFTAPLPQDFQQTLDSLE